MSCYMFICIYRTSYHSIYLYLIHMHKGCGCSRQHTHTTKREPSMSLWHMAQVSRVKAEIRSVAWQRKWIQSLQLSLLSLRTQPWLPHRCRTPPRQDQTLIWSTLQREASGAIFQRPLHRHRPSEGRTERTSARSEWTR